VIGSERAPFYVGAELVVGVLTVRWFRRSAPGEPRWFPFHYAGGYMIAGREHVLQWFPTRKSA
jgi:hypothetical protein